MDGSWFYSEASKEVGACVIEIGNIFDRSDLVNRVRLP